MHMCDLKMLDTSELILYFRAVITNVGELLRYKNESLVKMASNEHVRPENVGHF